MTSGARIVNRADVFVGRVLELAILDEQLDRARSGEARVLLLEGEPGIGKSSLLSRFVSRLDGVEVLRAGGDESEMLLSYGLLEQLVGTTGVHEEGSPGGSGGPEAVLVAGARLLRRLGSAQEDRGQPVVVVIDDLHWADLESTGALLFALRRLRVDRVLALIAARPGELGRLGDGWARFLAGDDRVARLALSGLGQRELIELGRAVGIGELSAGSVASLLDHTGGNPLYCRSLLEEMTAEDLLRSSIGGLPAPRALAAVILARFARLSPDAQELAVATSVLGLRAPIATVCALADLGDPLPALSEAESAGLLVEKRSALGSELAFVHPLVQSAVYGDLSLVRRRMLHERAAQLVSGPEALDHRVAAATGSDATLASELEVAARETALNGNTTRASRWLAQSAAISVTATEHERRLLDAFQLLLPGDVAGAALLEPEIRRLPVSARQTFVMGHLSLLRGGGPNAAEQLLLAWKTHDPATEAPVGAAAAGQLAHFYFVAGQAAESLAWSDRAVEAAGEIAELSLVGIVVGGFALAGLGRPYDGLKRLAFLPENANDAPTSISDAVFVRGTLGLYTGQLAAARRDLQTAARHLRAGVPMHFASPCLAFLGETEFRMGAWDDAVLHTELAVSLSTDADRVFDFPFVHAYASLTPSCRGEWDVADRHVAMALAAGAELGMPLAIAVSNTAAAVLASARADHGAVLEAASRIREFGRLDALGRPGIHDWRPLEIDALIASGRLDEAQTALNEFDAAMPDGGIQSASVAVTRLRGSLAAAQQNHPEAALCFETAHRIAEGLELPLDVALLDLADGRRLRQAGKRGEAIVRLRTARTGFERLGAEPYATASSRELERCGDASGGRASQARHGLTPAELGVARLVASGKSNREAADDLFVTVKTVEFHLRSVFAKLGITSRQQIQSRLGAAESD